MQPITFERFLDEVVSLYRPPMRAPRTCSKMRSVLTRFSELPGVVSTADVSPESIAKYVNAVRDLNPNTIKGYLGYLKAAFNYALERRYIAATPFSFRQKWIRGREPAPKKHIELCDIAAMLELLERDRATWAGHRLYAMFATFTYTGLRRDEGLALQIGDIDLETRILDVVERDPLKTEKSAAPIGIPRALAEILAEWIPRTGSIWLFPNAKLTGPWMGGNQADRPLGRIQAAARRAGVQGVTFQALRHSWATHAEHFGLSEAQIQRVLRHTKARTTKRYIHADLVNMASWVEDLDFTAKPPPMKGRSNPWHGSLSQPSATGLG